MRLAFCSSLMLCVLALPALGQQATGQQGAPATVPVGTVAAERKAIAKTLDFVGRVEGINRVQIVARVKGFLEAVLFKEGDLVKEGARSIALSRAFFRLRWNRHRAPWNEARAQRC